MALIELNLASKSSTTTTTFQQAFTIFKYKLLIEDYLFKKFQSGGKIAQSPQRLLEIGGPLQGGGQPGGGDLHDGQEQQEL